MNGQGWLTSYDDTSKPRSETKPRMDELLSKHTDPFHHYNICLSQYTDSKLSRAKPRSSTLFNPIFLLNLPQLINSPI